jgi:hypothetical protein
MLIVEQIHAFLKLSETFLRQSGGASMDEGWPPAELSNDVYPKQECNYADESAF